MKKTLISVVIATGIAIGATIYNNFNTKPVTIKLTTDNYTTTIEWNKKLSVFEALEKIAEVETSAVANFTIITAINSTDTKNGKYIWQYKVNGTIKKFLPKNLLLNQGDTVVWELVENTLQNCTK